MLTHTICFITRGSQVLMLNRQSPPLMGLWNGVGGKIEPGETPLQAVVREVAEETGIRLASARYGGTVTWTVAGQPGGMHAFVAALPPDYPFPAPAATPEGLLAWKELDWVLHPENFGVVTNIQQFLPPMLAGRPPQNYHFTYGKWRTVQSTTEPCVVHASAGFDA